jgi:uncharacterized protein (DUF1015 family)
MADVRPFRALRPRDDLAADVIAPPYDVLTEAEARAIAQNRKSFVRITRSEVDLPEGSDAHSDAAYRKARENLDLFRDEGWMILDNEPTYYVYTQKMGHHRQAGIIAACSVPEYDEGKIRKHEFTRPDKEDDRTHHMEVLDAQVGLVFLAFKSTDKLRRLVSEVMSAPPAWNVTTDDGVEHALFAAPSSMVPQFLAAFEDLPTIYIADGHHRSAAASRVYAKRQDASSKYFIAGLFPAEDLQVMAYNRVVKDLNGNTPDQFLARVQDKFTVTPSESSRPSRRGEATMFFGGRWHRLVPKPGIVNEADPVARLDASWLQDHLLAPILGIDDPRRSKRIDFVGGIRGPEALEAAVRGGGAVAFHMFPTGMDQLFAVADNGDVMPPKSTWFEPKLREGVAIRLLGEESA